MGICIVRDIMGMDKFAMAQKKQLTPFKVLSNVKSVSYSSYASAETSYSVSTITENKNLYCWGYNRCG